MSNAPILQFIDNTLSDPDRLDVAYLEATMLWPIDKGARQEAISTSTTEFARSLWPLLSQEMAGQLSAGVDEHPAHTSASASMIFLTLELPQTQTHPTATGASNQGAWRPLRLVRRP